MGKTYFRKWNLVFGWAAFAISAVVYILTMEPTASLWDCAEFISTSYKLEVGHPPGAPLFMMISRFFTMFAPSVEAVPVMVNLMSCLASAFTILFLFWTITHLGRKIYAGNGYKLSKQQTWTVMGAGLIGSLAYTFTDTFWFSAIEGEVYALSSMFTALVVWAMLQWELVADQPHGNRWLVLIAYLMGLSIGIHILNLLAIPALVFIYYFRKYPKVTWKGVAAALGASGAILVAVNYLIIPYTVQIGAWVDKIFVNSFGLPVNSGLLFFVVLVFALCIFGIYITHKKGKVVLNTVILCAAVIFLGYGSYASVIIRASANPPMNSNDPSNPYSLFSLLNRDQYGDRPLLYGPYYTTPIEDYKYSTSTYLDKETGKYDEYTYISGYQYPSEYTYLFPRIYSRRAEHIEGYKMWGNIQGRPTMMYGERVLVPTAGDNLTYFFNYQLNFMYWRYFLWNFVGRQNDLQGNGDLLKGNWLSGINFIDNLYLGPQDGIPSEMAQNKGRNKYYFLPFILGLIGLIYQLGRDKKNFTVVMWLFFMMGIALVLYFNTTPGEPRERDYVYAGSFYAFCIWIGLGVMSIREFLVKVTKKNTVAMAMGVTVVCACVPVILAAQNWDDHSRAHRYIAHDIGFNYLESTLPNSIIMNYGDNDTFPLWYNQEVEGVRLDVRIMNMSYLGADWYIEQMKIRSNDSDPVPFSLPFSKYKNHTNNVMYVVDVIDSGEHAFQLSDLMAFIKSEDPATKITPYDEAEDYIPIKTVYLPVNKENAIASGIVKAEDSHLMVDTIPITFRAERIDKSELMLLDLLANFDWKRPLYFTSYSYLDNFGMREYLQFDGFAYRLVPIKTRSQVGKVGRIDTEYLWQKLMEEFRYGNISDPRVYVDSFVDNILSVAQSRNAFARLGEQLVMEGDTLRAIAAVDAAIEKMPFEQLRHNYIQTIPLIETYYLAGAWDKGDAVLKDYSGNLMEYLNYFLRFNDSKAEYVAQEANDKLQILHELYRVAEFFGRYELLPEIAKVFSEYGFALEPTPYTERPDLLEENDLQVPQGDMRIP